LPIEDAPFYKAMKAKEQEVAHRKLQPLIKSLDNNIPNFGKYVRQARTWINDPRWQTVEAMELLQHELGDCGKQWQFEVLSYLNKKIEDMKAHEAKTKLVTDIDEEEEEEL